MTALEYLDYLIVTRHHEDDVHSIPIQLSELQALRAMLVAEEKSRTQ